MDPENAILVNYTTGTRVYGLPPIYPVVWRMEIFVHGSVASVDKTGYQDLDSWFEKLPR
jgi:gamma-glutamylcyclotransferase (GGCT)/AIG2-like uncharacterized protein YtfP